MRVLFAGTPEIALPTLEALVAAGMDVPLVLTRPDAARGRGAALHPSPVKVRAQSLGLRVMAPARATDPVVVDEIEAAACDVAVVVAYGQILDRPLLEATRLGWVNLHFSLLPAWRGAAPVQRAIMAGDEITGVSAFLIEEGIDTGPILGCVTMAIGPRDTAGDLCERLARAGAPLVVDLIPMLADGTASPIPQVDDGASHAAKVTREDCRVRWELPAHIVDRRIRGVTPAPGAWTTLPDGRAAKVGPVMPRSDLPPGQAGTIEKVPGAIVVSTGTDPVELGWIAPAGKAAMPAEAWWRGARLPEGAQLGEA